MYTCDSEEHGLSSSRSMGGSAYDDLQEMPDGGTTFPRTD